MSLKRKSFTVNRNVMILAQLIVVLTTKNECDIVFWSTKFASSHYRLITWCLALWLCAHQPMGWWPHLVQMLHHVMGSNKIFCVNMCQFVCVVWPWHGQYFTVPSVFRARSEACCQPERRSTSPRKLSRPRNARRKTPMSHRSKSVYIEVMAAHTIRIQQPHRSYLLFRIRAALSRFMISVCNVYSLPLFLR